MSERASNYTSPIPPDAPMSMGSEMASGNPHSFSWGELGSHNFWPAGYSTNTPVSGFVTNKRWMNAQSVVCATNS